MFITSFTLNLENKQVIVDSPLHVQFLYTRYDA